MSIAARTRISPLGLQERGIAFDVALALLTGLGIAAAKRTLDFHLGIPGHAGTSWIAVLVLGALVNRRRGMTVLAGTSAGMWGVPLGLHPGALYNAELFGCAGAALDILMALRLPIANPVGAAIGGAMAHAAKFAFIYTYAAGSGVYKHFELYGVTIALRNHLLFGLAGGLIAWAIFNAGNAALESQRQTQRQTEA